MKLLFSIFLFASAIFLNSCSEKTTQTVSIDEGETVEEPVTPPPAVEQRTIAGRLKSVSGVMDELSCYCSHGGYITADDGVVTAVCFDEEVESCDKITVTGYRTSRSIEANGACSEGIKGFLKVQSYIVGETDF